MSRVMSRVTSSKFGQLGANNVDVTPVESTPIGRGAHKISRFRLDSEPQAAFGSAASAVR